MERFENGRNLRVDQRNEGRNLGVGQISEGWNLRAEAAVAAWPDILTRDGWYERLHGALPRAPRLLGPIEREVLLARAAHAATQRGDVPPFRVRPALVGEMLALLDTILRLGRTIDAFERLFVEELEPQAPTDRGAERLLRQTRFLVSTFRGYRDLVDTSGCIDEHLLREAILAADEDSTRRPAFEHIVVTVGDRASGRYGLWPADFDLLARLPRLSQIDVIATEATLAAGFHERLQAALPGFEEVDFARPAALGGYIPTLASPTGSDVPWWSSRDREEEVLSIARRIKARVAPAHAAGRTPDASADDAAVGNDPSSLQAAHGPLDRVAIICRRPLPYVYLAHAYLGAAGIPFQAYDELPLAAEPFAAALDLVFRAVESGFSARPMLALLRSPHFAFRDLEQRDVSRGAVRALEVLLRDTRADGPDAFARLAAAGGSHSARDVLARSAAQAALASAQELAPLRERRPASSQFAALMAFFGAYANPTAADDGGDERTSRAAAAVEGALRQLAVAHATHDDVPIDFPELVARVRRWVEGQTFSPRTGRSGVHVVDAEAARYGDFDEAYLVGLIEREWPDRSASTIFYPASLLGHLGWPGERPRLAASRAAFGDLLRLPRARVSVSTFVLEEDALVEPSPFLDELERSRLAMCAEPSADHFRITADAALLMDPCRTDVLDEIGREWALVRQRRSQAALPVYHGSVGDLRLTAQAVRRIETYLDCPFKYFAESILGLDDDSDDPREGPRADGQFLHDVLAGFYQRWHGSGGREITTANIANARSMFMAYVEERLRTIAPAEAALWRARLAGTAVRTGVVETVLRFEAAVGEKVIDRLIEYRLNGPCAARVGDRSREITLRGVADRIDLLDGGRFRLVDYKLGRAPDVRRAIQLPVYALQAQRALRADGDAREPALSAAGYLAFGERVAFVRLDSRDQSLERAVTDGQARLLGAVEGIEAGTCPPRPADATLCVWCPYSRVCRKDYVDGN